MKEPEQAKLELPNRADKLLLHSCCAPCSGDIMEKLVQSGIDYTIFFYNPNIHPEKEYLLRKNENIDFADQLSVPFVDADYNKDIGLNAPKVWNTNPSVVFVAPCVSICVLIARRFMLTKMDLL